MGDAITRAVAFDGKVRVYTGVTTEMVEQARQIHDTWPTVTAALGRVLNAAALMAVMGDPENRLTLQVVGDGPVGRILAVADGTGRVKGYVDEPHVDLDLNARGKLDVSGAVGKGQLCVIRDVGLRVLYRGVVELVSGEIGEDIAHYFLTSEQTPSVVAVGVRVAPDGHVLAAGGFIIQVLPGAEEKVISDLEAIIAGIPDVSSWVAAGADSRQMLERLTGGNVDSEPENLPVVLACDCSKERLMGPLISLGPNELETLAADGKEAELVCHFCQTTHCFSPQELLVLAKRAQEPSKANDSRKQDDVI